MPTLFQKIRLLIRGWQRRREEHDREFLTRNASWTAAPVVAPKPRVKSREFPVDTEGLTVAYLDDSGVFLHFLDTQTGDIIDLLASDVGARAPLDQPRYRRVPARTETTEEEDRRAFIASLQPSPAGNALSRSIDADSFRSALASDRTIERAWYNFRNNRAIAAIEAWLQTF